MKKFNVLSIVFLMFSLVACDEGSKDNVASNVAIKEVNNATTASDVPEIKVLGWVRKKQSWVNSLISSLTVKLLYGFKWKVKLSKVQNWSHGLVILNYKMLFLIHKWEHRHIYPLNY